MKGRGHPAPLFVKGGKRDYALCKGAVMQGPSEQKRRRGWIQAFSALRHTNYRWYWISGLGMTAAQGIKQLALAWLVLDLTGSVAALQPAPVATVNPKAPLTP